MNEIDGRSIFAAADEYWSRDFFGVEPVELRRPGRLAYPHAELADYQGVFVFSIGDAVLVSVPPEMLEEANRSLQLLGEGEPITPKGLCKIFPSVQRTIGPAWIGYPQDLDRFAVESDLSVQILLGPEAEAELVSLRSRAADTEWEWSGLEPGNLAVAIVRGEDGVVIAAAGYEIWGKRIAHIGVLTDPSARGRGFGRRAVQYAAADAVRRNLIPQYRTLVANQPAMKIGTALGFIEYAFSIAGRF